MKDKRTKFSITLAGILMVIGFIVIFLAEQNLKFIRSLSPEIARSMSYTQVQSGDENISGTDVKFDAFFLRDLDGDGYAEKLRGTCREVGAEDTLYMELKVPSNLKNGKIVINGKNFYIQAAIPKDTEVKNNCIGNNVKTIDLSDIQSGVSRTFMVKVRSGDYTYSSTKIAALNNNYNNYSRDDNEIILTGTCTVGGQVVSIEKRVSLTTDWYGSVKASIPATLNGKNNKSQTIDITDRVDTENGIVKLDFNVYTTENNNQLLLSKSVLEAEIPQLNGYSPSKVEAEGINIEYSYNENNGKLTITRNATDKDGTINKKAYDDVFDNSRYSVFKIKLEYPIEAYSQNGEEKISLTVPVSAYYEGYNNTNNEFTNPYKSNVAKNTLNIDYQVPPGQNPSIDVTI